jgi:HK97 family phage portal protein
MALFGLVTKNEHAKLLAELEAIKAQLPYENWQLKTAEAEKYILPDPSVYANQADLYRLISWVLQSVDAVASACALTPFGVARLVAGKEPKDIPNHDFEILLQHPNPLDSRYEFLYATVAYWVLNGNSYWWLNRKSDLDAPDELWCIPPSQIKPIPDEKMYLQGYYYYPGTGAEMFLPPEQIVHFKNFNPKPSNFIGLSKVESIAGVAMGDQGMSDWNTRLFRDNNARLASVMTFEQMIADPTWEKIKQDTREAAKKREMLMLRGVGQGGVNWLQNSVTQKDMEFLAGRQANKEEIMGTLAPGLFTWLSGTSTYSNANANRAAFNELAVYPIHVMMNEKITNSILPAYPGRPLIGKFEDVRINDKALELQEQERYAETHTIKEIRSEFYGDEPLGDERDDLLPSQINAQSGGIQEPPPAPVVKPQLDANNPMMEKPQEAEGTPQDEPPKAPDTAKAALDRWRRYAVRVGAEKAVNFEHPDLTHDIRNRVISGLVSCKTEADIHQLFSTIKPAIKASDAAAVLEGLRLAITQL